MEREEREVHAEAEEVRRRRRIPGFSLTGLGWIAVLLFLGFRVWPQLEAAMGAEAGSRPAPAFVLADLSGDTVSLEALRGQVVLVNFWATWCPPCRVEMPGFQSVYEKHRSAGFVIVGLSTDVGDPDNVRRFLEERDVDYPVAMASASVVREYGGVPALPMSFLVDRQGRIRYEVKGFFAEPALDQAVQRLLSEGT